ncbi:MAG: hypothetical protein Q8911_05425 [Bacillota bacterium]|nr:hypothetical protein [Bacillota bacterium]
MNLQVKGQFHFFTEHGVPIKNGIDSIEDFTVTREHSRINDFICGKVVGIQDGHHSEWEIPFSEVEKLLMSG